MATEPELKAIIKKERGGRWIEYHGPYKIGARRRVGDLDLDERE
jgi:hypothetical protein